MIVYFVCSMFFINHCVPANVDVEAYSRRLKELKMTDLQYKGDKICIDCLQDDGFDGFYRVYLTEFNVTNGKEENITRKDEQIYMKKLYDELIDHLSNGNDLSLYFAGIEEGIGIQNGYNFHVASEWFRKSGRNICFIKYAYEIISPILVPDITKMVRTRRLEFVAKMVGDLVLAVQNKCRTRQDQRGVIDMSHVEVAGFSFGAHIASRLCRFLFVITGKKVRFLLGLDPAGIFFALAKEFYIQSGDAEYVQTIHTSKITGTIYEIADVDIYVKWQSLSDGIIDGIREKHVLVFHLYVAICIKGLVLIAEENGDGKIYLAHDERRIIKENECEVGVYSSLHTKKKGKKFQISFKNRQNLLCFGLDRFNSAKPMDDDKVRKAWKECIENCKK